MGLQAKLPCAAKLWPQRCSPTDLRCTPSAAGRRAGSQPVAVAASRQRTCDSQSIFATDLSRACTANPACYMQPTNADGRAGLSAASSLLASKHTGYCIVLQQRRSCRRIPVCAGHPTLQLVVPAVRGGRWSLLSTPGVELVHVEHMLCTHVLPSRYAWRLQLQATATSADLQAVAA